jgi:hypothetical protein
MPSREKSSSSAQYWTSSGEGVRAEATSGQSPMVARPGGKNIQVWPATCRSSSPAYVVIIAATTQAATSVVPCSIAARQPPPDMPMTAVRSASTSARARRRASAARSSRRTTAAIDVPSTVQIFASTVSCVRDTSS